MTNATTTKNYINELYDVSGDGYVAIGCKCISAKSGYRERYIRVTDLPSTCEDLAGQADTYVSVNVFGSPRTYGDPNSGRKVVNVTKINACYVDIDCYAVGLTVEQVQWQLGADCYGRCIPVPTYVVHSGRGMYLIWALDGGTPDILQKWQRTQKYLRESLSQYGADPQSVDAARILRLQDTVNSKSGATVHIAEYNNVRYTIDDIISDYMPDNYMDTPAAGTTGNRSHGKKVAVCCNGAATPRMRLAAERIASIHNINVPNFADFSATYSFIHQYIAHRYKNQSAEKQNNSCVYRSTTPNGNGFAAILRGRINDLHTIFTHRTGPDCRREFALFLHRLWYAELTHDYRLALDETLNFNNSLDVPLPTNYVITRTASAEKILRSGKTYAYKTLTLITALNITPGEQEMCNYLCWRPVDKDILRERKRRKNHATYMRRIVRAGNIPKATTITARRERVAKMMMDGSTRADIARALGVSVRTIDRDVRSISAAASHVKSALKRAKARQRQKSSKSYTYKRIHTSYRHHATIIKPLPIMGGRTRVCSCVNTT